MPSSAAPAPRVPALLLIGETGTGKSDASFHVFSRLYRAGTPTARLDLDDVGMSHPAPPDDPDNFRVKTEAMAACWEVFRARGARCLVVSGALDSREALELHLHQIPDADWTIVRLRIGLEERRRRFVKRGLLLGYREEELDVALAVGEVAEARPDQEELAGLVLDIDGLTSQEVVDLVLRRTGWPDGAGRPERPPWSVPSTADPSPAERPVLSAAAALEILTYLVTAARTQVDEAREYGPMRLMTGARRLSEQLPDDVVEGSGPALARFLHELGAVEPTATPTRDRTEYVERLDALCALAAAALLETHGRPPDPS